MEFMTIALQGDRERCLAAGMMDCAVKLLSLAKLQQLVERNVASRDRTESPAPVRAVPSVGSLP